MCKCEGAVRVEGSVCSACARWRREPRAGRAVVLVAGRGAATRGVWGAEDRGLLEHANVGDPVRPIMQHSALHT